MAYHALTLVLIATLVGCASSQSVRTTDPLAPIVIQEKQVPIAACPVELKEVVYPTRPHLAIDDLTAADEKDYTKIGQAYQQSIADLQRYAVELETTVDGIRDLCNSVNIPNAGK